MINKQKNSNIKRKIGAEKLMNISPKDLCVVLNNNGRYGLPSFLRYLPFSVLRNYEVEKTNHITQLFCLGVMFNISLVLMSILRSAINEFYQNLFINKVMELTILQSIFKDKSEVSSVLNYINNTETPIICYRYNKPNRPTIFNFDNIATNIKYRFHCSRLLRLSKFHLSISPCNTCYYR